MKKFLFFITLSLFASAVFSPIETLKNDDGTTSYICTKCGDVFTTQTEGEVHEDSFHPLTKLSDDSHNPDDYTWLMPFDFLDQDDLPTDSTASAAAIPSSAAKHPTHTATAPIPPTPKKRPLNDAFETNDTRKRTRPDTDSDLDSDLDSDANYAPAKLLPSNPRRGYGDEEKPYSCHFCGYKAPTSARIKEHERTHTNEKPFKCRFDGCSYSAAQTSTLKRHEQTHEGEKQFKCRFDGCSYSSAQKSSLNAHERKHTGEKPFCCIFPGCEYRTTQTSNLKRHEQTHEGEKQFKCRFDGCSYSTAQKPSLNVHERRHTGEKPYKCPHCEYRANKPCTITVHERIHTGEKPFKCGFCDYRATTARQVTTHERLHTGEKPFKCKYCEYRATERGYVTKHEKKHKENLAAAPLLKDIDAKDEADATKTNETCKQP